jgi:hypothetical protein
MRRTQEEREIAKINFGSYGAYVNPVMAKENIKKSNKLHDEKERKMRNYCQLTLEELKEEYIQAEREIKENEWEYRKGELDAERGLIPNGRIKDHVLGRPEVLIRNSVHRRMAREKMELITRIILEKIEASVKGKELVCKFSEVILESQIQSAA